MPPGHVRGGTDGSDGPLTGLSWWVLFAGDRLVLAGCAVAGVFALTLGLVALDLIAVGPSSAMPGVFGSMLAGLLTLITVILTINQLILSRVFGTPGELSDQLAESREFRDRFETVTGRETIPNEPGTFLSLLGEQLYDRTTTLSERLTDDAAAGDGADEELADLVDHADTLRGIDADEMSVTEVLERLLGSRTARNITIVERLRKQHGAPDSADRDEFDAVSHLLEGVAVTRQYYKTLALQQMLARLSRYVTYVGFVSILVATYVALIYRTNAAPAIDPQYLGLVASAAVAVTAAPLAVLLSYVLRIATISRYTLSVGPFVPPKEQFDQS